MVTMLTDHLGYVFFDNLLIMRIIGRIAFLLYAFMIAEGFCHYKDKPDRVKVHVVKIGILAIVTEFAYDLMESGRLVDWESQSAMGVLFLGLLGLIVTERYHDKPWLIALVYAATAAINYFGLLNFKLVGVLVIYAFYFYIKHTQGIPFAKKLGILLVMITIYFYFYVWARSGFTGQAAWNAKFMEIWPWLLGHYAAMVIIAAYNGTKGWSNKVFNLVYTVFYPAHLLVIAVIAMSIY